MITVGVADMKISTNRDVTLATYALGSCLGISLFDPVAGVGGLLHVMLPVSTLNPQKAQENPYMFVDTGLPRFFQECYKAGARKERLVVKVAGGASINRSEQDDYFQIGRRNFVVLRKLLWKNEVLLRTEDVGGTVSRTMYLELVSGAVTLSHNGQTWTL
ncbi:MAG: chemotaxis protein CheD [Chloroflexi bacterium]|nr:chemotaxis protein CheD [Chloroflexota bacterium]